VITVNEEPLVSFGFNGVEAGWNPSFEYCYNVPVGVTLFAEYGGTAPYSITYTVNSGTPVTVTGLSAGSTIIAPQLYAPGIYNIAVTNITDSEGCQASATFLGYCTAVITVNEEPLVSFGFNGVEAGWNPSFEYCYNVPVGVTLFAEYGGTAPYSITYTVNSGTPVTVTGLSAGSTIIAPQLYAPGIYNIAVTNITDSEGCQASATFLGYCNATVIINSEPVVNDVTLQADFGYSPEDWTWPVNGSYPNFSMCIDPLLPYPQYYFIDVNTLTSTVALQSGELNGFALDQASLPPDWLNYWANKGVDGSSTDPLDWTYWMWPIINGSSPIFYIYYDGGDYQMIDGLTYQWTGAIEPLKVNGDYPAWNYKYTGKILDINGCQSSDFDVFLTFNTLQPLDAEFTVDDLTPPTNTTVTFTNQSIGTDVTYSWSISPATYIYVNGTNSSSMNPKVRFLHGGLYSVTLTVSDACETDTEVKTDYIRAGTHGVWIGITSTEWNTPSNWDNALAPDRFTDVLITTDTGPDFWPEFTGNLLVGNDPSANCQSITFEGTGYMVLKVHGTLTTISNEGVSTVTVISGEAEIKFENP
jgi:PKD repeat protein